MSTCFLPSSWKLASDLSFKSRPWSLSPSPIVPPFASYKAGEWYHAQLLSLVTHLLPENPLLSLLGNEVAIFLIGNQICPPSQFLICLSSTGKKFDRYHEMSRSNSRRLHRFCRVFEKGDGATMQA